MAFSRTALGMVCLVVVVLVAPAYGAPPPNVVIVLVDACRADRVDAVRGGVPLMPYVASMGGVRFHNTTSACSWTLPSMTSLLTSVDVNTHRVYHTNQGLPASLEYAATTFKQAGYTTICVQTNGHLAPFFGFDRDFDLYDYGPFMANEVAQHAVADTQTVTEPFFLYTHYIDPHAPYAPPAAYKTMMGYPPPGLSPAEQAVVENIQPYIQDTQEFAIGLKPARTIPALSPVGEEAVRMLYDGEVRHSDDMVQQMLSDILARFPNTIVVVIADHGEHFFEHGYMGHTFTLYEELSRIPLVIKAPGLAAANNYALASNLDILPTLAAMTGIVPRAQWQGRNLFDLPTQDGPVYSSTKGTYSPYYLDIEMVRKGSLKFIDNRQKGVQGLFDYVADPVEAANLVVAQPANADLLSGMLDDRLLDRARKNGVAGTISAKPSAYVTESGKLELSAPAGNAYKWLKDGQWLQDNPPHVQGAFEKTLVIEPVGHAHFGTYECLYSDSFERLCITNVYTLTRLYPASALPAASAAGLFLALCAVALAGGICMRRRANY